MTRTIIALSLLAVACTAVPARAQFPEPSENHKILKLDEGTWDAEMKMWMAGPESEPVVAKGMETNKMLGDFWIVSDFTGEIEGNAFQGHGVFGYDSEQQKFVGTWTDSMSPYMGTMEGKYDPETKTMTMMMTSKDATGTTMKGKNVTDHKDKNTRVFTMYSQMDGQFVKMMEITYKRR